MEAVNIYDAKTRLSQLVDKAYCEKLASFQARV